MTGHSARATPRPGTPRSPGSGGTPPWPRRSAAAPARRPRPGRTAFSGPPQAARIVQIVRQEGCSCYIKWRSVPRGCGGWPHRRDQRPPFRGQAPCGRSAWRWGRCVTRIPGSVVLLGGWWPRSPVTSSATEHGWCWPDAPTTGPQCAASPPLPPNLSRRVRRRGGATSSLSSSSSRRRRVASPRPKHFSATRASCDGTAPHRSVGDARIAADVGGRSPGPRRERSRHRHRS